MSMYKVTYFPGTGRAELMRLLLSYSGTKFEDCRVTSQQWAAMKSSKLMETLFSILSLPFYIFFLIYIKFRHIQCTLSSKKHFLEKLCPSIKASVPCKPESDKMS